jgi:hypothetical protein
MSNEKDPPPAWASALMVLAAISVVALVMLFGFPRGVAHATAPKAFKKFSTPGNAFTGQGPENWKRTRQAGMGGTMGEVRFRDGDAEIVVSDDLFGSLMGDIAAASDAQLQNIVGSLPGNMGESMAGSNEPPIEKLHKTLNEAKEMFEDYEEQPMQKVTNKIGEGRFSEFTARRKSGAMGKGSKVKGWRATFLNTEKHLTVICSCPEADWTILKPSFEKVIMSLAPGGQ